MNSGIKTYQCTDKGQLENALSRMPPGSLFRGQTQEYYRRDGGPDIRTSFDRNGCIPHYMLKWLFYSKTMLQSFVRSFEGSEDLATDQAILQHYGWRSFFLDTTSRAEVACWFAAYDYTKEDQVELAEDCWEDPVFIRRTRAQYIAANSNAVVYVFNRKEMRRQQIGIVDLVEITTEQGRQRCMAQSAFMVGQVSGQFPDSCLLAKIEAPATVFAEYAGSFPDMCEASLFPSSANDPFLATLLRLPLEKMSLPDSKVSIDAFERGLPIPEYSLESKKIWHPANAFFRRFWLSDLAKSGTRFGETIFFLTSQSLFHGGSNGMMPFPKLTALLKSKNSIAVEIDGLVMSPLATESVMYGKGIYLEQLESGDILLCELSVEHPGGRTKEFGICRGYYYRPDESFIWHRVSNSEECDCGYEPIHMHHLIVAEHFENLLSQDAFQQHLDRVFVTDDVDPVTDKFHKEILKHEI